MITTLMAGFAFGYCVADICIGFYNRKKYNELLKTTVEIDL